MDALHLNTPALQNSITPLHAVHCSACLSSLEGDIAADDSFEMAVFGAQQ